MLYCKAVRSGYALDFELLLLRGRIDERRDSSQAMVPISRE